MKSRKNSQYYEKLIGNINNKIDELKEERLKAETMLDQLKKQYMELVGYLPEKFEEELEKLEALYSKLEGELSEQISELKQSNPEIFK